jgi:hypothetical protein
MPTRPPDGRSAAWTGSQWAARGGPLGLWVVFGTALGLGLVEFVWAIVVFLIVTSEVNALWEARGRVGYESITDWSLSVPFLLSLLIVPIVVAILTAANVGRHWWVGVLFLGGWPAIAVALIALVSPGTGQLENAAAMEIGRAHV